MVRYALCGLMSFSTKPLEIPLYLGGGLFVLSLIGILLKAIFSSVFLDFGFLCLLILLLFGIQLVAIGVIGLYVARIDTEAKNRPSYLLDPEKCINAEGNRADE